MVVGFIIPQFLKKGGFIKMLVIHFLGEVECKTCEELEQVLELKTEKGVNEFKIALETDYPYMDVCVNKNYACISYFGKDEISCCSSMDENNGLNEYGYMEFYIGNEYEKVTVPNYQVTSFSKAKDAIMEFVKTKSRPTNLEWEEL